MAWETHPEYKFKTETWHLVTYHIIFESAHGRLNEKNIDANGRSAEWGLIRKIPVKLSYLEVLIG